MRRILRLTALVFELYVPHTLRLQFRRDRYLSTFYFVLPFTLAVLAKTYPYTCQLSHSETITYMYFTTVLYYND